MRRSALASQGAPARQLRLGDTGTGANEISETCQDVARRICQTLEEGQFPISLGGDHSVAVGTVSGISKFYRERNETIGLIWIDAHGDMNTPESSPSGNVHAHSAQPL